MDEPGRVEARANRPDHAVHHAARGDHVGAGPGVDHRLLGQQLERGVVVDVRAAGRVAGHAALPVVGVLAETDVGDDQEIARGPLGDADGLGNDALGAQGVAAELVLVFGDAEEDDAAEAQFDRLADFLGEQVGRKLENARHRGDLAPHVLARPNEQRQDQFGRREPGAADQSPDAPDDSAAAASESWGIGAWDSSGFLSVYAVVLGGTSLSPSRRAW